MGRRRVELRDNDLVVLGGYEYDAAVLRSIADPENRLLWAFIKSEGGQTVQPVCFDETRVIWLTDNDLERTREEVQDLCS